MANMRRRRAAAQRRRAFTNRLRKDAVGSLVSRLLQQPDVDEIADQMNSAPDSALSILRKHGLTSSTVASLGAAEIISLIALLLAFRQYLNSDVKGFLRCKQFMPIRQVECGARIVHTESAGPGRVRLICVRGHETYIPPSV